MITIQVTNTVMLLKVKQRVKVFVYLHLKTQITHTITHIHKLHIRWLHIKTQITFIIPEEHTNLFERCYRGGRFLLFCGLDCSKPNPLPSLNQARYQKFAGSLYTTNLFSYRSTGSDIHQLSRNQIWQTHWEVVIHQFFLPLPCLKTLDSKKLERRFFEQIIIIKSYRLSMSCCKYNHAHKTRYHHLQKSLKLE